MKYLGPLAQLTLGVWFGGLIALILFVSTLFVKARAAAFEAAPVLFNVFERYQLGLAAVALLLLTLWRFTGVGRLKTAAVAVTLAATLLAVVQIAVITPKVNASRNVDRPTFDRYHGLSTKNYSAIAMLVLVAWGVTSAAGRRADCEPVASDLHSA